MNEETGLKEGGSRLNAIGKEAVNAYLWKPLVLLGLTNIAFLLAIVGFAYNSIQTIKDSATAAAEEKAVEAALKRVNERKEIDEAALATIRNSVVSAQELGRLNGTIASISKTIDQTQQELEQLTSDAIARRKDAEILKQESDAIRTEIASLETLLGKAKEQDGYVVLIQALDSFVAVGEPNENTQLITGLRRGLENVERGLEKIDRFDERVGGIGNRLQQMELLEKQINECSKKLEPIDLENGGLAIRGNLRIRSKGAPTRGSVLLGVSGNGNGGVWIRNTTGSEVCSMTTTALGDAVLRLNNVSGTTIHFLSAND